MKANAVEEPTKLIEDICHDWDAPMEYRIETLEELQSYVSDLHDNIPTSHLKDYLEELVDELAYKINSYSVI